MNQILRIIFHFLIIKLFLRLYYETNDVFSIISTIQLLYALVLLAIFVFMMELVICNGTLICEYQLKIE